MMTPPQGGHTGLGGPACQMASLLLLLFTTLFMLPPDARADTSAQAVLDEINLARTNPAAYVALLKQFRTQYDGNIILSGNRRIRTHEGTAAVDEAIAALSKQQSLAPLALSAGLTKAAQDHVDDIGPKGAIRHEGTDGSTPSKRCERYGTAGCGENISFGPAEAREIVLQLIVDDNVKGRGHRANIFNRDYASAGIALGAHAKLRTVCVIDFGLPTYKDNLPLKKAATTAPHSDATPQLQQPR